MEKELTYTEYGYRGATELSNALSKISQLERNVAELQEQLQNSYKRIAELSNENKNSNNNFDIVS
tara:strand:+ start:8479 stop:8673 length:195 start_codon:yes stop_codon:yes gene_type:complete